MKVNEYYRPTTLEEAYHKLAEHPQNAFLAGGLWLKKTAAPVHALIDLEPLHLCGVAETEGEIVIGAMTSLRELEKHPAIKAIGTGLLAKAIGSVMGVGLRRLATIGGSVAGKYPFSDIITALLALDATLDFYPTRTVTLADFLSEKGKPKDILTYIHIQKKTVNGYFHKVSNTPLDFAILNVAITYGEGCYSIAIGSRPGGAIKPKETIRYLNDLKHIDEETLNHAADMLIGEVGMATTNAASGEYRQALAKAYLKRGLVEVTGK